MAVAVGQRNAGVHFRNLGLRLEPIALLKGPAEARGKRLRHGALARTRYAHDDQNWRGAAMPMRALQTMRARRTRNEDRPAQATNSPLSTTPHPSDSLLEAGRIGDRTEIAVENSIAVVGDERLPGRRRPQICVGSERLELPLCRLHTKAMTSTGIGVPVPRRSTSLVSSTMMASRRLLAAARLSASRSVPGRRNS